MIQLAARPPNFEKILAALPGAAGRNVIFAYAPHVYVPGGQQLPLELIDHEQVHIDRQAGDPEAWWDRYLADAEFRYVEELYAHRAEWQSLRARTKDRNARTRALHLVALKLIAPLYGCNVTYQQAKKDLLGQG